MVKVRYVLFLLAVSLISCKTIKRDKHFYHNFVNAFYDENSKEPIIIYNKFNGKTIDTLDVLKIESAQCYYKFAFSKSKEGWLKIEKMRILPGCESYESHHNVYKYHNHWIKSKNLIITTSDCTGKNCKINFYENPNKSSKILYTSTGYIKTHLIEINGNWAKVIYQKGDTKIIGWLPRNRQCTLPWTNCIFN